jgi:hypothetical protein
VCSTWQGYYKDAMYEAGGKEVIKIRCAGHLAGKG